MFWQRNTFFPLLVALLSCIPQLLPAQTKITVRSRYDESPAKSFYPFHVPKRPKVGLVLSGGGARGAAQIGVIRALERHNIPIDFIGATSMGSIVGGLYASGYTTAEIESLALTTDWDDVLSLSPAAKRRELFIDQKLAEDWSFLVVRFQGLEPVIPSAVSSGQRLTDFLSTQALQALYHPNPDFDDLKIRFRTIATDLVSGKRIILGAGALAEALRASVTVPLLFNPIERDSMQLVDGGLVSNIPVDIARDAGVDMVIAVNSTSGLRNADELKAPWQTADQIMGIMMQLSNELQLRNADIVITPKIGRHLSSDFRRLDSLIARGERTTEEHIPDILRQYRELLRALNDEVPGSASPSWSHMRVEFVGGGLLSDSLTHHLQEETRGGEVTVADVRHHIDDILDSGDFQSAFAEIYTEETPVRVVYTLEPYPPLREVEFDGCKLLSSGDLRAEFTPLIGKPLNQRNSEAAFERVLRAYRKRGYSLARLRSKSFDSKSGILRIKMDEGIIAKIDVQGGVRTQDPFVLREFPLQEGDVFEIDRALQGITNINGMKLFEFVYLEVSYAQQRPVLTIRVSELPSQLVRFGVRADNERSLQGTVDIRDENFHGTGAELGLTASGGGRNGLFNLEYKSQRLISSNFNFSVGAFYSIFNSYVYSDAQGTAAYHWDRTRIGEYADLRYGGRVAVGTQLEKLGNAMLEYSLLNTRIKNLDNHPAAEERHQLAVVNIGTVIDSRDSYPFPTKGIGLKLSYEFASEALASDIGYNALRVSYESYITWGGTHTLHPKFMFGFADKTMPLAQQFRLGGRESLFGVREDDRRGRQLIAASLEYRLHLPIKFVFDTYWRVRYDLGSISSVPEEIKLNTFRHGIGSEIALDTPIGQATFGVGKGFFFARDLPNNPISEGPFLFYFTMGYEL